MRVTQETLEKRFGTLEEPSAEATPVERIRYLIRFLRKTQAQFGELINVDPSNMSKIMSGRLPLTDRVVNRIVVDLGVSKDWLLHGSDVPFPRESYSDFPSIENGAYVSAQKVGAPVYDIDVAAGTTELSQMFTDDRIVGRLNMPQLSFETPIIHVSGDSMSPRIPDNSYISIKPIALDAPICWGRVYVVVTEDYRLVKMIRRHPNPDMVILHSCNPNYDDMELRREDIKCLYLVVALFNYEILG